MISMLQSELFRARKRRQTWITIGIVAVATFLFYVGFTIAHLVNPDNQEIARTLHVDRVRQDGLTILGLLGGIVAVVFGAGLVGSEYSWNTMRSLVARAKTRYALIVAKWLAAMIYVVVLVTVTVITAYVSATIASIVAGEDLSWSAGAIGDLLASIVVYSLSIAPYVAVAVFVAIVFKSNAAAIAAGIAVVFIEPIIFALLGALSDVFESISKGGLAYNAGKVTSFHSGSSNDVTSGQFTFAVVVLLIWIAAFIALSTRIFMSRDVTSG